MALPTITSNSPSAGYIAWTASGITFDGEQFPIAAGNTNKKFTWWQYNAGVPILVSSDTLPALADEDILLFLNKNGVGVLVPMTDVTDGSLIVTGSILAPAIAADQIETYHINAGAVTATEIQAGAIGATHISAGAITADKLSVGTVSDNMVVNGSFEDALSGTLVGWEAYTISNGTITPVTGVSSSGAVAMQFVCTNTSANLRVRQLPAQYIPVSAASGRKYYISTRAGASTATTSGHYMRVNWYDGNKTLISSSDVRSNGALTTTFTLYEGQATPPATAKYMGMDILITNVNVATTVYVDEVSAHEVTMSAQIGDGQITAAKILTNTITATQIAAGAITADRLAISDWTNYATGGGFDAASDLTNYTAGTGITVITTDNHSGTGCLQSTALASARTAILKHKPKVTEGEEFYIHYWFKSTSDYNGTTGNGKLRIGNQASGYIYAITHGPASTTWVEREYVLTIPAGMTAMEINLSFDHTVGTAWIDELQVRRMNGGELIVDGTIYASKIATDAVTSDKIIANAITSVKINADAVVAGKIAANAITAREIQANTIVSNLIASDQILANHIYAGAITADKIDANAINGKTITGATVQTAATGARVVMDSSGLGAWDAAAKKYLTADANGISIDGTIATTGGTNWLGEDVVVKISDTASTSGGRNIAGLSFEREGLTPIAFPAVYSDSGTDLMLTAVNNQAFLSLANENSGGEAELQGQGINLYSNTGDVKIGKTYNTPGNLQVAKINGKRPPIGLLSLQRLTGTTTVTTTDSQISAVTVSVTPGMVLEVSGSYAGGPSGASGQYLSWGWKANGVRFAENSHRSNTVPAGQTSVTISLWGLVAAGGGTYVCPADSNSPKLQYAIKDIGDV